MCTQVGQSAAKARNFVIRRLITKISWLFFKKNIKNFIASTPFFGNSKKSARISNIEFDYFAWNFSIFKRWKFRKLSSWLKWPTYGYFFFEKKWPTIALNEPLVYRAHKKSPIACWEFKASLIFPGALKEVFTIMFTCLPHVPLLGRH